MSPGGSVLVSPDNISAGPRFRAEIPGFSQPQWPSQPQSIPEPAHSLEVHQPAPAGPAGHGFGSNRNEMSVRQAFDLLAQGRLVNPPLRRYRRTERDRPMPRRPLHAAVAPPCWRCFAFSWVRPWLSVPRDSHVGETPMSGGPIFGEQTSIRETQRLSLESLPLPKLKRLLAPNQQQASRNHQDD